MRKAVKYDALQLANDLVKWPYERYEAAAELRRLHALNAELVEALRGLAGEVERFGLHHPDGNSNWWPVTLEKAQAALTKVGANNGS